VSSNLFNQLTSSSESSQQLDHLSNFFEVNIKEIKSSPSPKLNGFLMGSTDGQLKLNFEYNLGIGNNKNQLKAESFVNIDIYKRKILILNLANVLPDEIALHEIGIEKMLADRLSNPNIDWKSFSVESWNVLMEKSGKQARFLYTFSEYRDFSDENAESGTFSGVIYSHMFGSELKFFDKTTTENVEVTATCLLDEELFLPPFLIGENGKSSESVFMRNLLIKKGFTILDPKNVFQSADEMAIFYEAALTGYTIVFVSSFYLN